MSNENEIPDWNNEEEEIPPALQQKWDEEDEAEEKAWRCRSCGKPVRQRALLCVFCGGSTGVKVGLFGHLRAFLTENLWGVIIFLAIFGAIVFLLVM